MREIGIKIADGAFLPIAQIKNTDQQDGEQPLSEGVESGDVGSLPKTLVLKTTKDDQESLTVDFYERQVPEDESTSEPDERYINTLTVANIPKESAGGREIFINVADKDGSLDFAVTDSVDRSAKQETMLVTDRPQAARETGQVDFSISDLQDKVHGVGLLAQAIQKIERKKGRPLPNMTIPPSIDNERLPIGDPVIQAAMNAADIDESLNSDDTPLLDESDTKESEPQNESTADTPSDGEEDEENKDSDTPSDDFDLPDLDEPAAEDTPLNEKEDEESPQDELNEPADDTQPSDEQEEPKEDSTPQDDTPLPDESESTRSDVPSDEDFSLPELDNETDSQREEPPSPSPSESTDNPPSEDEIDESNEIKDDDLSDLPSVEESDTENDTAPATSNNDLGSDSVDELSSDSDFSLPDMGELPNLSDDLSEDSTGSNEGLDSLGTVSSESTNLEDDMSSKSSDSGGLDFGEQYSSSGDFGALDDAKTNNSDNSAPKKRHASVVICIICAIICLLAVGAVLLFFPGAPFNHLNPLKTSAAEAISPFDDEESDIPLSEPLDEGVPTLDSQETITESPTTLDVTQPKIEEPVVTKEDINSNTQEESTSAPAEGEKPAPASEEDTKETIQKDLQETPKNEPEDSTNKAKSEELVVITEPQEVAKVAPEKTLPPKGAKDVLYTVKWGDTLWDIAASFYRNPWKYHLIAERNGLEDPDYIISGTTLLLPKE